MVASLLALANFYTHTITICFATIEDFIKVILNNTPYDFAINFSVGMCQSVADISRPSVVEGIRCCRRFFEAPQLLSKSEYAV